MTVPDVHPPGRRVRSFRVGVLCCFGLRLAIAICPTGAQTTVSTSAKTTMPSSAKQVADSKTDLVFDIASIHPNRYDRSNHSHLYTEANQGRLRAINASILQVIEFAYTLPDFRILNAPEWVRSDKFDIEAESDEAVAARLASIPYSAAKPELAAMVRSLLTERFHLAAHIENRRLPVYFLVVAKKGPRLTSGQDASKHLDTTGRNGAISITISNSSHALTDLAQMLYPYAGRVIMDKTGLAGNYSLVLHFSQGEVRAPNSPRGDPAADPDVGISVFTAMKEQLGLELKPGKAPVSVLVIDKIEPPTEN